MSRYFSCPLPTKKPNVLISSPISLSLFRGRSSCGLGKGREKWEKRYVQYSALWWQVEKRNSAKRWALTEEANLGGATEVGGGATGEEMQPPSSLPTGICVAVVTPAGKRTTAERGLFYIQGASLRGRHTPPASLAPKGK